MPNPANPQSGNRYAYVLNSPIRYNDPSGHRACEEGDGNCNPYTQADQINDLKSIVKDRFKWNVKGDDWTVNELLTIYETGLDIETYVNNLTGGRGRSG